MIRVIEVVELTFVVSATSVEVIETVDRYVVVSFDD